MILRSLPQARLPVGRLALPFEGFLVQEGYNECGPRVSYVACLMILGRFTESLHAALFGSVNLARLMAVHGLL